MKITILTNAKDSWYLPYGAALQQQLSHEHEVAFVHNKHHVESGDICFLLSCTRIVEAQYLELNTNNIVVHASDLPKGKGFSPIQWQIFEGTNSIVLTLFEAVPAVDAGPYYFKESVEFEGHELLPEIRDRIARGINEMCQRFVDERDALQPLEQQGNATMYPKRTRRDDRLDIDKSIRQQFDHLRIADNDKWPLFFEHLGKRYLVKIFKEDLQ